MKHLAITAAVLFASQAFAADVTTTNTTTTTTATTAATVHCMGINSCKGQSLCKTIANSCKGQNSCKGKGWVPAANADECKSKGGTIVE